MIVNPAYNYYAKSGPLPDFYLWSGGVVNVPYTKSYTDFYPRGSYFEILGRGYVEFTVDAEGYSKFYIELSSANNSSVKMNISFYNSSGGKISTVPETISGTTITSFAIDIPSAARISGAKIRVTNDTSILTIYAYTAALKEE